MIEKLGKPLTPSKFEKGGVNEAPTTPRPEGPPPGMKSRDEEQRPPSLEQMEGAKSALFTFVMYHFQALRQAGYDTDTAKQMTANMISELHAEYAYQSGTTYAPKGIVNPAKQLEEIMSDVKALGPMARSVYNKLIDFKKLLEPKGE